MHFKKSTPQGCIRLIYLEIYEENSPENYVKKKRLFLFCGYFLLEFFFFEREKRICCPIYNRNVYIVIRITSIACPSYPQGSAAGKQSTCGSRTSEDPVAFGEKIIISGPMIKSGVNTLRTGTSRGSDIVIYFFLVSYVIAFRGNGMYP